MYNIQKNLYIEKIFVKYIYIQWPPKIKHAKQNVPLENIAMVKLAEIPRENVPKVVNAANLAKNA